MVQCSACDCQGVPVWSRLSGCSCVVQCSVCDCQGVPVWSSVVSVIVRTFLRSQRSSLLECPPDLTGHMLCECFTYFDILISH